MLSVLSYNMLQLQLLCNNACPWMHHVKGQVNGSFPLFVLAVCAWMRFPEPVWGGDEPVPLACCLQLQRLNSPRLLPRFSPVQSTKIKGQFRGVHIIKFACMQGVAMALLFCGLLMQRPASGWGV